MTGRDRIVMMVAVLAAGVVAFWFLALAPMRREATELDGQLATQRQRLDAATAGAAAAGAARGRYRADYAVLARLGQAVPADDGTASLLYQLESAAKGASVSFRSIKLGGGSGGAAPTAPANSGAPAGEVKRERDASAAPASGTPAPPTQVASAGLPPGAAVGPAGFPTMPFTFVFGGSFFDMESFLHRVDRFVRVRGEGVSVRGRLLAIDGIALAADGANFKRIRATMTATAFVLPADEGVTATAASPGAGSSPPPTASAGTVPAPRPATAAGAQ